MAIDARLTREFASDGTDPPPQTEASTGKALELSQTEMANALDLKVAYTSVSGYEPGKREPDLIVLLRYERLAKVSVESLIDDKLNLKL